MNPRSRKPTDYLLWVVFFVPLLWLAVALAQARSEAGNLAQMLEILSALANAPFSVRWTENAPKLVLIVSILYPMCVIYYVTEQADLRPGGEYGTARWGNAKSLNRKYRDRRHPRSNYLFTQNVRMGMDSHKHRHNLNVMVIGGSGAGKTRFYVKPNLMQSICSYIVLDPKGEILRDLGGMFEAQGIAVTVIDLVHFKGHYNPLVYLETDEDAMKLAHAIVHNTKPKDAVGSADQFWDNSSIMLISAIILYLLYEAPAEEQNLSTVMYMILNGQVSEDESYPAPLAMLFNDLEDREPDHPAVLQYKSFLLGSTKTLQSVLVTAASNLHMFNSEQFAYMTGRDETFLPELGLQKRVIFCVIPDNDETYNFLITMLYTQIFDQLFRLADSNPEYKGALPVHVRLMMDEFANVALPKDFKKILSVCRSRNISCDIILQSIAQLKSLFKDDWEGIVGNCDSLLYLGGNEYGTFEYLSKILGKETERTVSHSIGRGNHGSSSESQQKAARDLATPDEIRRMSNDDALLLLRSEDPVVDRKYDLLKHPNIKMTTDGGAAPYVMPYDFMQMAVSISQKELATIEPDKIPAETLDKYELIDLEEIENAA
ncbi:type IV secretory system conjugative DNA transfer family protein [Subdoligranulum sp. DSM 109015]|uniref:Type IV secretory system conjugative DNA transfer family protein n=1 Tax=Gemmiger gallinarum TaxID=2779354 RepID=A0ABR9R5I5_9FIRM|nr:type IV secretory system conjugative DNA transfer family protein [Gemmiger gallinarum]MBE5038421.1 type IV secretory system conjugative DNA transfer family protein [Gemmiger gallinarum]